MQPILLFTSFTVFSDFFSQSGIWKAIIVGIGRGKSEGKFAPLQ